MPGWDDEKNNKGNLTWSSCGQEEHICWTIVNEMHYSNNSHDMTSGNDAMKWYSNAGIRWRKGYQGRCGMVLMWPRGVHLLDYREQNGFYQQFTRYGKSKRCSKMVLRWQNYMTKRMIRTMCFGLRVAKRSKAVGLSCGKVLVWPRKREHTVTTQNGNAHNMTSTGLTHSFPPPKQHFFLLDKVFWWILLKRKWTWGRWDRWARWGRKGDK